MFHNILLFQDYDLSKLSEKEWVAVAYENNKYFVGQVEKINDDDVQVNFLYKASINDYFYWPQVQDKAIVEPNVIFYPHVKVFQAGRKFRVHDLKEIVTTFEQFSKKYFNN